MTVASEDRSITYNCNGSVVEFAFDFPFFLSSELVVTLITIADDTELILTETTDYVVSTTGNTFRDGAVVTTVATYSNLYQLRIERVMDITQLINYTKYDAFPAEFHEDALDRLTMIAQQFRDLSVALVLGTPVKQGYILYYDGSDWTVLPYGTAGQLLQTNGQGANPSWEDTGSGDMLKSTYDPGSVEDNAFDMDNMVEGTTTKILTSTERTKLAGIETGADVTDAENVAGSIAGAAAKTTPVDADTVGLIDSADSSILKQLSWANIKATLKTYLDTLYVALTGNQTVAGIKTFSSFPVTPSSAPTTDYQAANKKYVDDNAGGGGIAAEEEKTDNYTILDAEINTLFVLGRATAADKQFDLPTLADNLGNEYICENASDYLLTVAGEKLVTGDAVEAGTTTTNITATAHGRSVGQVFVMTSGDESGERRRISAVVDVDNFTLENALSGTPTATETFDVYDAIDGDAWIYLGKGERKYFYAADLTNDEWRMS